MEDFVIELSPQEEEVRKVIEPLLESEGYELVRIRLRPAPAKLMLCLFIDTAGKKNGVLMDNLVDISRLLSDVLDASFDDQSVLKRRYDLEVSSPGLDRPLTKARHFAEALGEKIKLRFKPGSEQGHKGFVGALLEATDAGINILPEGSKDEPIFIDFKDLAEAHILFDFSKLDKQKKKAADK
jgi:ribosome maturation factor RimP